MSLLYCAFVTTGVKTFFTFFIVVTFFMFLKVFYFVNDFYFLKTLAK